MISFNKTGAFNTILTNKKTIESCTEYLDYVFHINNKYTNNNLIWFRGVSAENHTPIPKIHRLEKNYSNKFENFLMTQFILKARKYNYNLQTKIEWMQLMQHYGLPTRLLDWSEGALIGLFFAVRSENCQIPSVWIIEPINLNEIVSKKRLIFVTDSLVKEDHDSIVDTYFNYKSMPTIPIAISPTYIDQRLQVQKSVFTLHGEGYDELLTAQVAEKMTFFKLRIESKCQYKIRKQLELLGIDESTLFPDLEGISRDFDFKFELNKRKFDQKHDQL